MKGIKKTKYVANNNNMKDSVNSKQITSNFKINKESRRATRLQQLLRERHPIAERGEDAHQSGPSGISDRSSPSISPCIAMATK